MDLDRDWVFLSNYDIYKKKPCKITEVKEKTNPFSHSSLLMNEWRPPTEGYPPPRFILSAVTLENCTTGYIDIQIHRVGIVFVAAPHYESITKAVPIIYASSCTPRSARCAVFKLHQSNALSLYIVQGKVILTRMTQIMCVNM